MKVKILCLSAALLLCFSSFSQTPRQLGSLDMHIGMFVEKIDNRFMEGRQSELAQLILEIDSSGNVGRVHVMGNDADTIYKILKRMQPADFENWTCAEAKRKTMIIPYFYISDNLEHNYVYKLYIDMAGQRPEHIVFNSAVSVIVKYMVAFAPGRPKI